MFNLTRARLQFGSLALVVSSLLFASFPIVRPFFPNDVDTSDHLNQVVSGLTSPLWPLSHLLAGAAFGLLLFGLLTLHSLLAGTPAERRAFWAVVTGILGTTVVLLVVGAETIGLSAVANAYSAGHASDMAAMVKAVRTPLEFVLLFIGLIFMAVSGGYAAAAIWKSKVLPRQAGLLVAVGLVFWLPVMPQPVRIADGIILGVGGIWLGMAFWRASLPATRLTTGARAWRPLL